MKSVISLFCAWTVLVASLVAEEQARQTMEVDGKSYPVYMCHREVKPLKMVNPVYPASARERGKGGEVLVGALIDAKGRVKTTFVAKSRAESDIEDAAKTAVGKWRFPTKIEDEVVGYYVVLVPIVMVAR